MQKQKYFNFGSKIPDFRIFGLKSAPSNINILLKKKNSRFGMKNVLLVCF